MPLVLPHFGALARKLSSLILEPKGRGDGCLSKTLGPDTSTRRDLSWFMYMGSGSTQIAKADGGCGSPSNSTIRQSESPLHQVTDFTRTAGLGDSRIKRQ